VERTVAEALRFELVAESGEPLGSTTCDDGVWEVGDVVPCGGHMFEIRAIEGTTLHVRRVI
jgi:hypothetical protein